jgi:hypothetical protein
MPFTYWTSILQTLACPHMILHRYSDSLIRWQYTYPRSIIFSFLTRNKRNADKLPVTSLKGQGHGKPSGSPLLTLAARDAIDVFWKYHCRGHSIMIQEFDEMTILSLRTLKILFIFITSQFINFYQHGGSEYNNILISILCSLSSSQAILLIIIYILAISRYCCF